MATWWAALATLPVMAGALCGCGRAEEGGGAAKRRRILGQEDYDSVRRPDLVIASLGLSVGDQVVDLGAGRGYFTHRLAVAVGPTGRVVATDIDPAVLAEIDRRPVTGEMAAIETRVVEADEPGLEPGRYDLVLMAEVDHLLSDRAGYLAKLRTALASGGRLAVANRLQHRAGLMEAAREAGYAVVSERLADLPGQFLVVLIPATGARR